MEVQAKIVGVIQAKNEWPLLALSISYALMHHVDEVYVLNHNSTDGTLEGLECLTDLWNDKIHVLSCYDEAFWQEAMTNLLIEVCQASFPDWIYIFDSDEFLLTEDGKSLKEVLGHIDCKFFAVKYQVRNWISVSDFDEACVDNYRKLRYRSVPNQFIGMYPETCADEIWFGNYNFYDIPFPAKVIFRNSKSIWVGAGAHVLKNPINIETIELDPDRISAAHFPLLTKERVEKKAKQGQSLITNGFPASHGWQSQMIYKLFQEKKLGQFWISHSIGAHNGADDRTVPTYIIDDGFVQAIDPVLRFLERELGSSIFQNKGRSVHSPPSPDDTSIPFRTGVHLARNFQLIGDSLRQHVEKLSAEHDFLSSANHILRQNVDLVRAQHDALINSRSWRYTKVFRLVKGLLSRGQFQPTDPEG